MSDSNNDNDDSTNDDSTSDDIGVFHNFVVDELNQRYRDNLDEFLDHVFYGPIEPDLIYYGGPYPDFITGDAASGYSTDSGGKFDEPGEAQKSQD